MIMNINISKVKIVVMVPRNYTDNLRELICKTKAGVIGNYTDCSVSHLNRMIKLIPRLVKKEY